MGIRKCVIAGFTAILLFTNQATADICSDPLDLDAVRVKSLQTELMVAALRCDSGLRYNAFVQKFEAELVTQGRQLRGYFSRAYGAESERRLDQFVTFLANTASLSSIEAGRNFCTHADATFVSVMGRDVGELATYVTTERVDVVTEALVCQRVAALIDR